jgi:hypothetical protein
MKYFLYLLISFSFSVPILAEEQYRITLLRAAPDNLPALIQEVRLYKKSVGNNLSIMRHSQGDHWDLMLLEPAGETPIKAKQFDQLADFQHSFIAESKITWEQIEPLAKQSDLFHIEMFHAVHGKAEELLKQRQMENQYLAATQRNANIIFKTTFGSDVDSFTIGYYKDLVAFAVTPDLPKEVFEKAATDAGFKARSDIGFYLRELILSHQDTLATRID